MNNVTLISYPDVSHTSLLSLTEARSRYMLPLGGRYRVVDFTIRNAINSECRQTIIYSMIHDGLTEYIHHSAANTESEIKVVCRAHPKLEEWLEFVEQSESDMFIAYKGDNPSIIDFNGIIADFRKKKCDTVIYKLEFNGEASLAQTALITKKKSMAKALKTVISENRKAPNPFELILNTMMHQGIESSTFPALYWLISDIPDYYHINMNFFHNGELFDLLFKSDVFKSRIRPTRPSWIGPFAKVVDSLVTDGCSINGIVENSIIFPGVTIGARAIIHNSIILPFCNIGDEVRLNNVIIDEHTQFNAEMPVINIGNRCRIGTEDINLKNNDYPQALYHGISLIGKNTKLPPELNIGAACYIESSSNIADFGTQKTLFDGLTIRHTEQVEIQP